MSEIIVGISVWVLPVVLAITLHEVAHGWAAMRLGDDTAHRAGRITLNPVRHVDPLGTVILPGMLVLGAIATGSQPFVFGWAKPVPVNFGRLHRPKTDMVWVALAGPGINIALAILAALALHLFLPPGGTVSLWAARNLDNFFMINIMLACFNMLPLLPLDGGRVLTGLLPMPLAIRYARTERFGLLVVLLLVAIVPLVGAQLGLELNPLSTVLLPVVDAVYRAILVVTGWI